MNGVALSRRRTGAPHWSQVVSAGADIDCRTSKTRRHPSHSYSYVGMCLRRYMGAQNLSRQLTRLAVLLALVAMVAACAAKTVDVEGTRLQARAVYERGLSHMRDRQPALALGAFREAITIDPSVALYHNTLGLLYLELSRPDLALAAFQTATSLDGNYADAHLNTGVALAETGRWEEAVTAYRKAVAFPTLSAAPAAYQNLGLALYHLRRYREAEEALRFALSLDPRMEAAYYNLGLLFVAEGRPEDAKAAFRRTRDLAPQSPFGQAAVQQLRGLGDGG
jgi:Tfp pilus assembly protein PilF